MATAYSLLAGRQVDTSSEIWRHECECSWVLAMPDRDHRLRYLFGVEELTSDRKRGTYTNFVHKGVKHVRGIDAANNIKADCERLWKLRREARERGKDGVED